MTKITVIGSVNMDIVNTVDAYPAPGETVKGTGTTYHPGGKGANQAVAAARAGAEVSMLGAVGEDPFARTLLEALREAGVDTTTVAAKPGTSGMAFITVDGSGENVIILSEGANGRLAPADLEASEATLKSSGAVLLQNEIPWETTCDAMRRAKSFGLTVYMNPAPARAIDPALFPYIDVLVVNETEAEQVAGTTVDSPEAAERAARALTNQGVGAVIVTLGSRGALYVGKDGAKHEAPAFRVQAVDTTAAGDTFIGAFAAAKESGFGIPEALRFASASAALTVTRKGAQAAIPTKAETERFLAERAGSLNK
ncbi:ribokinase [Paenibacillus sp. TRM 82003]|nr:ribokinase [Paenibacillus sp. TRM 82003]